MVLCFLSCKKVVFNNFYQQITETLHSVIYDTSYLNLSDMSTYGRPTTSEIIKSGRRDLNGDGIDINAEKAAFLSWSQNTDNIILSGSSDITRLSGLRGAILKLKEEFFNPSSGIVIAGDKRENFDRRFLLLEHELDGLLKRKISYTSGDGERSLDYTSILNEKENQIVEL